METNKKFISRYFSRRKISEVFCIMTTGLSQLGKNGITEGFINSLKNDFKKHVSIRISVLRGAGRERGKVKKYSEEILDKLGKNYTSKIIGFVIVVRKWRRAISRD